jgi:hypothetical protein
MPEPITVEPRRRGARVADRDGHVWERVNTLWSDTTDGEAWRGRWPWYALLSQYGPLVDGERYRQHQRDQQTLHWREYNDVIRAKAKVTADVLAEAETREAEWNRQVLAP